MIGVNALLYTKLTKKSILNESFIKPKSVTVSLEFERELNNLYGSSIAFS